MLEMMKDQIVVAYHNQGGNIKQMHLLETQLRRQLPGLFFAPLTTPPAEKADIALVWLPPPGRLAQLKKLKAIISLGHGVDYLWDDPDLPPETPIIRLVDPDMANSMSHWVTLSILNVLRDRDAYAALAAQREFRPLPPRDARAIKIGIYGVGSIGTVVAKRLAALGFIVFGWSQTEKHIESVISRYGDDNFSNMLTACDFHVCLLPLTSKTRHLFNRNSFAAMKKGAYFINAGRGGHVVEADLLAAIDSGHLSGAALDVFAEEPLPPTHPFWQCENIAIWPHVAAPTNALTAVPPLSQAIRDVLGGRQPQHQVDRAREY